MFFFPKGNAEGRGEGGGGRWGDKQERVGTWRITREEEQGGQNNKGGGLVGERGVCVCESGCGCVSYLPK